MTITAWMLATMLLLPQAGRDSSAFGGAVVSGVVVSDDANGRPVRHALVTLAGNTNSTSISMITGDDGAFALNDVRPGAYRLTASKPGFQATDYGTSLSRDMGTPIAVDANQRITGLLVPLRRGAVISGIVTGPNGEPVMQATVSAARVLKPTWSITASVPLFVAAQATTDDTGAYRLYGLAEGDYAMLASVSVDRNSTPYVPIVGPTGSAGDGPVVTVGPAEERDGVDMRMRIAQPARVQGTLIDHEGRPAAGRPVRLDSGSVAATLLIGERPMTSVTTEDGSFSFAAVPAGTYEVHCEEGFNTNGSGPPNLPAFWARTTVVVDGKDVTGVALALRRAAPVSGRLTIEQHGDNTTPPFEVSLLNLDGGGVTFAKVGADGTFSFAGAKPGRYSVEAAPADNALRSQWRITAATISGRSMLKDEFTVTNEAVTGIALTVSDDVGAVRGSIVHANNTPAPEYLIVVLSDTTSAEPKADFRVVAPDSNGNWLVNGLVPGAYRVAAISAWSNSIAPAPSVIEQLRAASTPVVITRGSTAAISLRVGPG